MKPAILITELTEQQARDWLFVNHTYGYTEEHWSNICLEELVIAIADIYIEEYSNGEQQSDEIDFTVILPPLKTYKVTATMTTDLHTYVDAYDEAHALRLGKEIAHDGGMTEDEGMFSGDFTMGSAYEQDEGDA